MLNFEQFAATRKEVADLGIELGLEDMNGKAGFVYADGYIEKSDDELMLVIENQDWLDEDLPKLERILYENWYVHQHSESESTDRQAE